MSHCPSCGRYAGPHEACPYCGARLTGRTPIRVVKITAILLTTAGIAILWFAATRAEVPLIQIGQAGATTNMAYVRLQGRCTRAPSYDPESGYFSFWIEDDTGEIRVSAYRAETQQIIAENHVPALGDQVEVAGTLRVREDWLALTINVPEQLTISRAEPVNRDIGSIAPEDQYLRVRVRGQVRSVYEPYQGLALISVRDGTGSIPVAVSEDLVALSSISPTVRLGAHEEALTTGQPVEVTAAVSLYDGTPQLVPASLADIVPLSQPVPVAVEKHLGELTTTDVGRLVVVRGTVTQVDPFSAGVKVTLDDTTGTTIVLLWQSVYDALRAPAEPDVGAEVQVQGKVSQYRGELEVIPELPDDVQVLAAATASPAHTPIGALTVADVGRWVTLRGTLASPVSFSAGVRFPLDDGTGQIVLLMWQDVYENAPEGLGTGAQVIVTGQVAEYRGELELTGLNAGQIVVVSASEVPTPPPAPEPEARAASDAPPADVGQALTPDPTPTPTHVPTVTLPPMPEDTPTPVVEITPISAITADCIGEEVTVEGTVVGAASFSAGFKFTLDDGTGQITLLTWHAVYADCWDAAEINLGARVRATGQVGQDEGTLQLEPDFGGDVKAIEGAVARTTPREIGSLTGDDEGQRVTIEGEIIRVEGLSSAVKVFVGDTTGETLVFIWRTVLDHVANNTLLGTPGSRVRVVGTVEVYKGNLEIVPTLPNDVMVLGMP
jgi:DNA/RNA endonuclease YhcR with UshA esterase domain